MERAPFRRSGRGGHDQVATLANRYRGADGTAELRGRQVAVTLHQEGGTHVDPRRRKYSADFAGSRASS
jgi:hypothetical protein